MVKTMKKVAVFLILVLISRGGMGMSIFSGMKSCVFSNVTLRLLWQGEPLKNAKVTRHWNWQKDKYDQAVTDENGVVKFPVTYESSVSRLLPIEFVVSQHISVLVKNKEMVIWKGVKRDTPVNSEYGGKEFIATCELTDEEVFTEEYGQPMKTKCKLDKKEK